MQAGRASTTAALVALARAIAHVEPELSSVCRDPIAHRLLPPALRPLARTAQQSPWLARVQRYGSLGMVDHLALRTALIDCALTRALAQGIDQVVLLGAGLDARAHRMGALAGARVFEVDHPDSQRVKRKATEDLPLSAAEVRYTETDFQRVSLTAALGDAGHDSARPTAWIWEGVTMYLPPPAVGDAIAEVTRLSAPRSAMIVSYVTPGLMYRGRALGRAGAGGLGLLSEPVRCALTPEDLRARFAAHGWSRMHDDVPARCAACWNVELGPWARALPDEHVAVLQAVR